MGDMMFQSSKVVTVSSKIYMPVRRACESRRQTSSKTRPDRPVYTILLGVSELIVHRDQGGDHIREASDHASHVGPCDLEDLEAPVTASDP